MHNDEEAKDNNITRHRSYQLRESGAKSAKCKKSKMLELEQRQ